jgi:tRNA(fMet)-specific endonuclease VapC
MMYVLDTNILIYYFKGMGNVAEKLLSTPPMDIGLPTIVLFEISDGIAKSTLPGKRKHQLDQLSETVQPLPFDRQAAQHAAVIRAELESRGCLIGPYDILIAATALSVNGTLITHNVREFQRVNGLRVEDWYSGG